MSSPDDQKTNEKQTVTIRGVDSRLYEKLVKMARDTGRTVGELTNQAMSQFLSTLSEAEMLTYNIKDGVKSTGKAFLDGFNETKKDVIIISNLGEVVITKAELNSAGRPVSFRNITKLVFPDMDQDTADKFIDSIISVDEVAIPPNVNKLMLLRKCRFVKKITVLSQ
ncbi:MAG: hypothetical protein RXS23_06035 [Metallosphaera yellowstonensis]|jgi:hypothetical protein